MVKKISLDKLRELATDPDIAEADLKQYFIIDENQSGPFRPVFRPNPETVDIDEQQARFESAMGFVNGWGSTRRDIRFQKRLVLGDKRPILVSEGDSWFQFPAFLSDVIDQLFEDYTIKSFGAAGDTAANMVKQADYLPALRDLGGLVEGFLFSGAGNDIIGKSSDGVPNILALLHRQTGDDDARDLINQSELDRVLRGLRRQYQLLIEQIRGVPGMTNLPLIFHGYDYAFPGAVDDRRDPIWADPDQWLGKPLRQKNITEPTQQREIIKILIDELYQMLHELAASHAGVHVVDVRGLLNKRGQWADEIHPDDGGFRKVAAKFAETIEAARRPQRRRTTQLEATPATALDRDDTRPAIPASIIVVDPGHGGSQATGGSSPNNATGPNGTLEKTLCLEIGRKLEAILENRGHRVPMTRATDRNLSLAKRVQLARDNQADAFVSIHFNGFHDRRVQGTETYHYADAPSHAKQLATAVQSQLINATRLRDRGVKAARLGVLRPDRHDEQTAACLVEVSFLTDPNEESRLQDEVYLDRIADALADGVEDYLQVAHAAPAAARFESASEQDFGDANEIAETEVVGGAVDLKPKSPPLIQRYRDIVRTRESLPEAQGIADLSKLLNAWRKPRVHQRSTNFELAIGVDNALPYNFLTKGAQSGRAVCKITASGIDFSGRSGRWFGSGFLVGPNLLLTNNHVVNSIAVAENAHAIFDYLEASDGAVHEGASFRLAPDKLFVTSPAVGGLDYTFVAIAGEIPKEYGQIKMRRDVFTVAKNDRANIIHHPNGDPKEVSLQDNHALDFEPSFMHYTSDTEGGSSGSPVFDNEWQLIALHHAWDELPDDIRREMDLDTDKINEGVKLSAIAIDLETKLQSSSNRAAVQTVLANFTGSNSITGFFGAHGRKTSDDNSFEAVVNAYNGGADDIDVAFWNIEKFHNNYAEKIDLVARIISDINCDIWALSETSPEATEALARRLDQDYGLKFDFAASEPNAPSGRKTTAVLWNPETVEGQKLEWPDEIDDWLRRDSRNMPDLGFEAVDGKIFNRYPALFRFTAKGRAALGGAPFDFNLVPLHLKAMDEGAKRRRQASEILQAAVNRMIQEFGSDHDWVIGGDINAELASGQFAALTDADFLPMSAADEAGGAITYLKGRHKSLIDSIFLSPNMAKTFGAEDFFIYAGDAGLPNYVKDVSDHRPVLARLSLKRERPAVPPIQPNIDAEKPVIKPRRQPRQLATDDLLEILIDRLRDNPKEFWRLLSDKFKD